MAITTIAPSITTNSPSEFKEICERYAGFAKRVHFDCADDYDCHADKRHKNGCDFFKHILAFRNKVELLSDI